jgi:hypothetical protein
MIMTILAELGRHSGKDNGKLPCTNKDLVLAGFGRDYIKPTLIELQALGFIAYKSGRAGLPGYGRARRIRITFLPILDADGKEIEPPTDEWARFNTTEEAKMAVRKAKKRAKVIRIGPTVRTTSIVVRQVDHVTDHDQLSVERQKCPENIESHGQTGRPLSTSSEPLPPYSSKAASDVSNTRRTKRLAKCQQFGGYPDRERSESPTIVETQNAHQN